MTTSATSQKNKLNLNPRRKKRSTFEYDDEDDELLQVRAPISSQQRKDREKALAAAWVNNPWTLKQRMEMDAIDAAEAAAAAAAAITTKSTATREEVAASEASRFCSRRSSRRKGISSRSNAQ